jgi:hypothetical protein
MASTWKERVPKWWQALLILVGGIVLGLSSCAVFLFGANNLGTNSLINVLELFFAAGFFGGVIVAIFGLVLLIKRSCTDD